MSLYMPFERLAIAGVQALQPRHARHPASAAGVHALGNNRTQQHQAAVTYLHGDSGTLPKQPCGRALQLLVQWQM